MPAVRIVSLLPAATEIVAALGAEGRLVGISHECDWPLSITHLPRVTWTPVDGTASSAAIDREVRTLRADGRPVIAVDAALLRDLAPDLILTQGLCHVCAVGDGQVHRLADALEQEPAVLSLAASNVAGIMADIRDVARALDLASEADELIAGLQYRLGRLRRTAPAISPRVLCVEWLDPLYLAGHWVPELVTAAGGVDIGATAGAPSRRITAEDFAALRPDRILVMLCGFGLDRARRELERTPLPGLGVPVRLIDGNAYTSRPGPRVVDGASVIREALESRIVG